MKALLIAQVLCKGESAPRYYLLLNLTEAGIINVLSDRIKRKTDFCNDTPRMPNNWRPGYKLPRGFQLRFKVLSKLPLRGIACVWKIDAAGCRKIWIREG